MFHMEQLLETDLVPVGTAAAALGIPEKRLVGFMARNTVTDPIGGDTPEGFMVYGWSCRALAERMAAAGDNAAILERP